MVDNMKEHKEKKEKERKLPYRSRLFERQIPTNRQKKRKRDHKRVTYSRQTPAIIPLEATIAEADPRAEPIIFWLDLTGLNPEEEEITKINIVQIVNRLVNFQ